MKTLNEKLVEKLEKGIVSFSFYKSNGEIRYAVGTQDMSLVPVEKHPKTNKPLTTAKTIIYFDYIRQNWRSLAVTNIIRINTSVNK